MMNAEQMLKNKTLIEYAYTAFNDRKIDLILQVMHPDVKWSKAWEGDYANGHDEVRAYWERQWKEINPKVSPVGFSARENGALAVEVDQLVKNLDDKIIFQGKVMHIYIIDNGLIKQMNIEPYTGG